MGEHRSGTGQLGNYVREFMERTGDTPYTLSRRSRDPETGQELLPQWIKHLTEGRIPRSPEQWRYRALAAGMDVGVEKIRRLAAAQWIGVELVEAGQGEWITLPPGLSEEGRRIVIETAQSLARRLVAEGENVE
ncbi:hypothetical protein [Planobispora rosea]|uniref:hypothetical protein n=1 Tax=Planobispora rosea TaxID=35762 RepID=UPI000839EC09|nr:hypothetical protein [Planobispora rosea]